MKIRILAALILGASLTVSAAAQDGKWKLSAMRGKTVQAEITLNINGAKIGGNGGCNAYGGSFSRKGTRAKFAEIFSTKMFCDETSAKESEYFEALEKVAFYRVNKGELILLTAKRKEILRFKKN